MNLGNLSDYGLLPKLGIAAPPGEHDLWIIFDKPGSVWLGDIEIPSQSLPLEIHFRTWDDLRILPSHDQIRVLCSWALPEQPSWDEEALESQTEFIRPDAAYLAQLRLQQVVSALRSARAGSPQNLQMDDLGNLIQQITQPQEEPDREVIEKDTDSTTG